MNGGDTERGVFAAGTPYFFAEMLLDGYSRVQAGDGIESGRIRKPGFPFRKGILSGEFFSAATKGPLPVDKL